MISLNIDGKDVIGVKGQTILDIARENGIDIPTLCHDERVKPYGSCGLCVVEIEGWGKLVRSCATEAEPGMIIHTNTERIKSSRKTTLEMLLSDHSGDCRPPCYKACPAEVDCQGYVGLIANRQFKEAAALLKEYYPIPASIGLVCPHPCEDACRRQMVEEPIAIANLKAFAACRDLQSNSPYMPVKKADSGKSAAVIGAGPAGLTAAYFMALDGHRVTVYDAMPAAGGMLRYGIPQYRLPKELLDQEIDGIAQLGVEFVFNVRIPDDMTLAELKEKHDAVFIGIGAWISSKIGCQGEETQGVIGGIDFLRDVAEGNRPDIGQRVAVIGGGNTAMDAARTAVRLGAGEVMVLYRRTRAEMPAQEIEIIEAEEEGVIFKYLVAPEEIISEQGKVKAIRMQKMQLGEADSSGRRRPVPIPGDEEIVELDTIIAAIGQQVNAGGFDELGLSRWGSIDVGENSLMTNVEGIFAGGDAVTGPGIAIEAVAQGKKAAESMSAYLNGKVWDNPVKYLVKQRLEKEYFADFKKIQRIEPGHEKPEERRHDFRLVPHLFSDEEAVSEAGRCLECGCADYFECNLIRYAGEYQVNPDILQGDKHQAPAIEQTTFFTRDMNKCILCGLCVRICEEVIGASALGLVNRGFDTVIEPEFGLPLQETDCISCGQCVAVCPTGALVERSFYKKNVPLKLDTASSSCSYCSMACNQIVRHRGDKIYKIEPEPEGLLCARGRFGWSDAERLAVPLMRQEGRLVEREWEDILEVLNGLNKGPQNAVAISLSSTVEAAEAAVNLAQGLGSGMLGSFTPNTASDLEVIFGEDIPVFDPKKINEADLIIMLGTFNNNHIPTVLAGKAAGNGSKLVVISQESSLVDDKAYMKIFPEDNDTGLIKEILAAAVKADLFDEKYTIENYTGFEEFKQGLEKTVISEPASQIADLYMRAEKPLILIDGINVSSAGVQLLAELTLLRNDQPVDLMVIGYGGNAHGVFKSGVRRTAQELTSSIKDGKVDTLFIIGEDPVGTGIIDKSILDSIKFVAAVTPFMTDTAAAADIVIPCAAPYETRGTYIGASGQACSLEPAAGPSGTRTIQSVIEEISAFMGLQSQQLTEDKAEGISFYLPAESVLFNRDMHADYALADFEKRLQRARVI